MARLTVTDRNLLTDEIIRRLEKDLPDKEEVLKKAIQQEGLRKDFNKIEEIEEKIKTHQTAIQTLKKERNQRISDIESKCGCSPVNYYYGEPSLLKTNDHLINKYSEKIPSRKEIETAILLSQGGDDMNALMNNVIEQLKNR